MIFLRYEKPMQYIRMYPVTTAILLIIIAVFAAMLITGSPTDPETLIRFGAQVNAPPYESQLWRIVTAMFIHIGFEHLLFNGFALYVFAPPLERMLGKLKYTLLYFGSGIVGNLAGQLLYQDVHVSAGASGAIYGVFAAYAYLSWLRKGLFDKQTRSTVNVMLAMGLIYTLLVPKVNLYAHLGGFVGGFLILHVMIHWGRKRI
ncbi:MAG: rhomboid family protein [Paenibacillaceae bacterium]|jgi:rhomboid protease GluP|nr:rhomboid family protein [Paenibacillaceae bacterium]